VPEASGAKLITGAGLSRKQRRKHLVRQVAHLGQQVAARRLRILQDVSSLDLRMQVAARHLQHGLQLDVLGGAQAFGFTNSSFGALSSGRNPSKRFSRSRARSTALCP